VERGACWSLDDAVFCNMPRRAKASRALSLAEIQAIEAKTSTLELMPRRARASRALSASEVAAIESRAAMLEANAALWQNALRTIEAAEVPPAPVYT
jgi:capsid protein